MRPQKICFVSSSGGHWEELMRMKQIAQENCTFYVTEKGGQSDDCGLEDLYLFAQINRREKLFIFHFLWVFLRTLAIMIKRRPDVVITTGALISYSFCVVAKLMGKKVIYVESLARIDALSITGRLVYPFADLFLVQWESLQQKFPKAKYYGSLF